jgi:two-component system CheB/CheR fusion protein
LWGLRESEVRGVHFLNLDIGLPVAELKPVIKETLTGADGNKVAVVAAINRRGRAFECRVTCSALRSDHRQVTGAILLMEDQRDVDEVPSSLSTDPSTAGPSDAA